MIQRLRALVYGVGLLALVAVLTPIWLVHHVGTRLRSAVRRGGPIEIPRRRADAVALDDVMSAGRPVIVEGLVESMGLADVATPRELARVARGQQVKVTEYDAERPFFLYSGGYDTIVRSRRSMPVDDLLTSMFDDGISDGAVVYQLFGVNSLDGEIRDVLDRFDHAVRARTNRATEPRFSGVWVGSPGAVTPLHHDAWPGLLFQTHGTKRVAMYAPRDRTNLYFRSPLRGEGRWSMLPGRSGDASTDTFARLARTTRHTGSLQTGDVLFIPPFWAHEMEATTANVSVPFRFAGRPATYLNPGFLRPASEMMRKQLRLVRGR